MNDDSPWITLFKHQSFSSNNATFQTSFVTQDSNGLVSMNLGYIVVDISDDSYQVLFVKFDSSKTSIKRHNETVKLNYDVFNQIKGQVVEKLGDNAKHKIGSLDI